MLIGRGPEGAMVTALLARARVGQGSVLVLVGEAGIGKTALLEHAAGEAVGMTVLRATGSEPESAVPFGGLLQLLRPALVHLHRIPLPQADALSAALALAPGTGGDRFAVGAATLSLLSRLAEDQPVAALVEDAHLLDLPSAQAMAFAARRLGADPVALLVTARDREPGPFSDASLPRLAVGGLDLSATSDLLLARGLRLAAGDLARLHLLTGGNPLGLIELAQEVQAQGGAPLGAPVALPASLARAFVRRVDRLPAAARTAALVAATGPGDIGTVARACSLMAVDVTALEDAEDAGLLRVGPQGVVFRHGLVRSAVYSDAAPSVRRAVHRALAAALPADDTDRRAWHLGEAALGPDEDVARALTDAALAASLRSAHAVAAGAFERAARLSPHDGDRLGRLVRAGEAAWDAGLADRAVALLTTAAAMDPPAALGARIAEVRGAIAARTGSVEQARDLLVAAGNRVADSDPDQATMLLADAVLACFFLGDTAAVAGAASLIGGLADLCTTARARLVGVVACGVAGVLTGLGRPDGIRSALAALTAGDPLVHDPRVAPWLVLGPLFLRETGTGRELVPAVIDNLRRRSIVGGLPLLLFHVGRDQATTDHWDDAELTYTEGIQLAREAGQFADLAACLAGLAWLEARRGQEARCREHADEVVRLCLPRHMALFHCWSMYAVGELELALGRPDAALAHLGRLEGHLVDLALVDVDLSPAPERVDALVRTGREDEAREVALGYQERAAVKDQPWALARAARAVGLTCPDDDVDRHFARALAHHARTPDVFELARTELAHGARLRRARRRVDARAHLRAALAALEALGAVPWADQAAAELEATGETAARRSGGALSGLTPQELHVARMLAAGRTTREAAAALFLSPKTVEYHLRHVYVKLGVSSRNELAARLDADRPAPRPGA